MVCWHNTPKRSDPKSMTSIHYRNNPLYPASSMVSTYYAPHALRKWPAPFFMTPSGRENIHKLPHQEHMIAIFMKKSSVFLWSNAHGLGVAGWNRRVIWLFLRKSDFREIRVIRGYCRVIWLFLRESDSNVWSVNNGNTSGKLFQVGW